MSDIIRRTISVDTNSGPIECAAAVIGPIAVHVCTTWSGLHGEPLYSLTHLPSGLGLYPPVFEIESDAIKAVQKLVSGKINWATDDPTELANPVVRFVFDMVCQQCNGFDPQSFEDTTPAGSA